METFAAIVRERAGDDAPGLFYGDETWTWRQIVQESADRAAALTAAVDPPRDRQLHVGVLLDNVPDFVFWLGATALSGTVLVGINSSRSGPEIARDMRHTGVDVVITQERLVPLLSEGDHGLPADRVWVIESADYRAWLDGHAGSSLPDHIPDPGDIAALLFSSGSTGAPKAVIVGQGRLGALTDALVDRTRMRRESVAYLCMPLFHGNAIMLNLATAMRVGAAVAMVPKFSASAFGADIHRYGVTFVNYVGRALSYVLSRPADPRDADSTLELAFGTEASAADVAQFSERFGCEVVEGYGMSEGVFRIVRTPETPDGALGVPAGGADVRVLDEATGLECPRAVFDEAGRLRNPEAVGQFVAIGGAARFEGYWDNAEAMADRVRGEDFWSGDLGYLDTEGFFWFAGRSSDWLRVDSENFAAAQVERIVQRMPGVLSAVVYAVPDARTGDQVMCSIELDPGADLDAGGVGRFLAEQPDMGSKWWPRYLRIVDRIPSTASNKVNKAPLRQAAWYTEDPVYVRVGRTSEYRVFDAEQRAELEAEFASHGRASLLPATPVS